ncbi:hypothetical protein [Janthinobacterium agaricidamnosum]|nr:hypothetical protein [Janthinobacterium agaricidamnosum]
MRADRGVERPGRCQQGVGCGNGVDDALLRLVDSLFRRLPQLWC